MAVLLFVFRSFWDWLIVWVQVQSLSRFPGRSPHTHLNIEDNHSRLQSLHLDIQYQRNVPPSRTKVSAILLFVTCNTDSYVTMMLCTNCCFVSCFGSYSSIPAWAEDWGGWMSCFKTGFLNMILFYMMASLAHIFQLVLITLLSLIVLQLVYVDISQEALRQQRSVREPSHSTVYSSVRFSWLQLRQSGGKKLCAEN